IKLKREQVQARLKAVGGQASPGDDNRILLESEVLPVNPDGDGVTSDRFTIRTGHADEKVILASIAHIFENEMESRGALAFKGWDTPAGGAVPVYKITYKRSEE